MILNPYNIRVVIKDEHGVKMSYTDMTYGRTCPIRRTWQTYYLHILKMYTKIHRICLNILLTDRHEPYRMDFQM
jgi:hypothetical protein